MLSRSFQLDNGSAYREFRHISPLGKTYVDEALTCEVEMLDLGHGKRY